jgi:hypothetical protein
MNATEKQALERALRNARPADVSAIPISSAADTNGIKVAIRQLEGIATRSQKGGSEVLLVVVRTGQ